MDIEFCLHFPLTPHIIHTFFYFWLFSTWKSSFGSTTKIFYIGYGNNNKNIPTEKPSLSVYREGYVYIVEEVAEQYVQNSYNIQYKYVHTIV